MIAPLRARHRAGVPLLGLVTITLFFLAITSRPAAQEEAAPSPAPDHAAALTGEAPGHAWLQDGELVFLPDGDPSLPDLLLYWSPSEPEGEDLPQGSHLLGALDGDAPRAFPALTQSGGFLTIYSLAHARVVATGNAPGGSN